MTRKRQIKSHWIAWSLLALLQFVAITIVRAQTPLKQTLDNGLTVLVQENHAAPGRFGALLRENRLDL